MAPHTPLRLMVVDDNHLIRRLLTLILEGAGLVAVEAECGADALGLGREEPPDVWLIDEAMPSMTGSELIQMLRQSGDPRLSSAPIVGFSGRPGASRDLLTAGADSFLRKPIDEPTLFRAIARALAARGLEQQVPTAA